ncbi:hypothetical protein L249_8943 [Ophiocordyceps polyrhachis-furcata BCC 54312]|uniref:Major facilitator superfamily (MFS) profile domain-containing protein n=1 Tax=Ophiocordyceps polyrhachis-furcata BCC 54312 TaxID=1330021 RepID=A0A367L228_9HYPO|nr:hypothetical protein L249_8943 [Ophiocordyceps polyrhachis-furcata BCC 54312]
MARPPPSPSLFAQTGRELIFSDYGDDEEEEEEGEHGRREDDDDDAVELPTRRHDAFTLDEEREVCDLLDRRLVLFVALLYMLSFLDRSNIGNARIAGMEADLQRTSSPRRDDWYEWSLTAFYLTYMTCEWLALLWRFVPAHVLVSSLVLTWGLAASFQAVATSYPVLIALRAVLAVGEAGFAALPLYLSFFFRRDELAVRTGIFIAAAPLASSFASALAWLILRFASLGPIAPWRLLFLAEGFPSVLASVIAWTRIPDGPGSAAFLSRRQRRVARLRLLSSDSNPTTHDDQHHRVLTDPVAWLTAVILLLANMAYASLPVFLPLLVRDMGHGPVTAQALSAPPFLFAAAVVVVTARLSDRLRGRTAPLVFHAITSATGYALLAAAPLLRLSPLVRYLALFPAAAGFFSVVTLVITWNINNQPGRHGQGLAFALMQFIGQLGPLVGTRLYPARHAPFYTPGMLVCACAMSTVAVLGLVLRRLLRRRNLGMDRADDEKLAEERERLVGQAVTTMTKAKTTAAAAAPRFRYML